MQIFELFPYALINTTTSSVGVSLFSPLKIDPQHITSVHFMHIDQRISTLSFDIIGQATMHFFRKVDNEVTYRSILLTERVAYIDSRQYLFPVIIRNQDAFVIPELETALETLTSILKTL